MKVNSPNTDESRDALNNVVILTKGIAGSSVLSALLGRAGYWVGDVTYEKSDYDTFENTELIEINKEIFEIAGFQDRYERHFRQEFIPLVASAAERIDGDRLRQFVAKCNEHRPWLWKDPRLWLTVRVWRHWLDLREIKFIHLRRDPLQSWISTTVRRQIQSRKYSDEYGMGVDRSIETFLEQEAANYLDILYEDLIDNPKNTLNRLNEFLGTSLQLEDLKKVYRGDLYKARKGFGSVLKAYLIYLKNYRERYDLG